MLEFVQYNYETNPAFYYYILTFVCIIGLIFGSFINVVGLRLLSGESIVFPPSKCPNCNTKLKWYDNIPVLAYLLLLGKCRYCKVPISWQYPVVEAVTATLFLLIFLQFGFTIATPILWILAGCCVVMCITDFREQVIFDAVSMPLIPIGLVYSYFNFGKVNTEQIELFKTGFLINETFVSAIIGITVAFLFFEIISLISRLLIKHRAFGEGDTIIAMVFGAFFGWKAVCAIILLSFFVQAFITLPIMLIKLLKIKDRTALLSFIILILSAVSPLILTKLNFFNTAIGSVLLIFGALGTAGISALIFLKRMKELDSYTLLPFGPALIGAGFLVIFFYENIINFIGL